MRSIPEKFLRLGEAAPREGRLAVEEPLEIRVQGEPVTVTMRTPGDDLELAAGFLFTEGIVRRGEEIGAIRHCATSADPAERNVVDVTLTVPADLSRLRRNFMGNSSCGLCGKTAIHQIRTIAPELGSDLRVSMRVVLGLAETLRRSQPVFDETGGLHAAAVFDEAGTLLVAREDIGRHNAVDKSIGAMFLQNRTPLGRYLLMVSGRASFEILQKARMASIQVVCSVSAPSSLAVQFAHDCGMTLVGFLRPPAANVYCGESRLV